MTPKEIQSLIDRFPLTLSELRLPPGARITTPLAERGIECGPGWSMLLEGLFAKLEPLFAAQLAASPGQKVGLSQVKEKFGALRVYVESQMTDEIRAAIGLAEEQSKGICEVCGAPGRISGKWMACRCEQHTNRK